MISKDKIIKLTNRDTGFAGYTIPDTGVHRRFTPGETKEVTFEEVEKLSWADGGKEILRDYLIIEDEEAAREILGDVEPEYFYKKETVQKLLKDGSLEQLEDALEFAPKGVKELIKQEAVETKLDSAVKREAIKNSTHFNVSKAIELNEGSEDENVSQDAATSKRRSTPMAASSQNSSASGRKATQNFKIIN